MDSSEDKPRLDRTREKMGTNEDPLVESKYVMNQRGREERDYREEHAEEGGNGENEEQSRNNRLDEIEDEIKKCGQRLEEIQSQQRREDDKYSESYLELENQRNELKKRVIDLDYHHKLEIANSMRESRRKEAEAKSRVMKEAEEEREKRKRDLEERVASSRKKQQPDRGQAERGEESEKKEGGEAEDSLARSRRQLRIAEIERELAESRLRRSRMSALNSELDYLRATYSYPYWTWRDYYPYSLSSLYPYTSSLYYPSPYSYPYSYLSPYRYRWWL